MRLYPSLLIALGILHQVEIFLHEIGVDEFQLDLLLMPFVYRVVGYLWLNLLVASEIATETQLQVDIATGLYPLWELMKSVGKLW